MKKTTGRLRSLFLAMGVLLTGSIILTYLVGRQVTVSQSAIQKHDEIINELQMTFTTVQDAETGQRGYLLTGDDRYLDPYLLALTDIRQRLTGLQNLAENGLVSKKKIFEVSLLISQKLEELNKTVELAKNGFQNEARDLVAAEEGREMMSSIRDKVGALQTEQEMARSGAYRRSAWATGARTTVYILTALINLGFLFWAYRRINRAMASQYVTNLEIDRQREILSVTLTSIGDAVIITDTNGSITFLNKIAEELTGWTQRDAIGKPCNEVFRIINETTREPAASPVDDVLQTGKIIGLKNHTILIRKDGTEVPIDDSGAPIREGDETLRGVVLVFRDFTAHREAQQNLIKAKEEIEAASNAKDKFIATLSHELRTPLTPVVATLSAWEANHVLPDELQADLQLLRRNVEMEARLIDDLLDVTRIEHGKLSLEKEIVDAHGLLDAVVALYRSECEVKGLRLTMAPKAASSFVEADPARLQQVFWNLVGNAVKFTSPGGFVEIATSNSPGGKLTIVITDNGLGISKETLSQLFQRFQQGDLAPDRKSRGLGLGLSIAKALIEAHHGTLVASSAGPGNGSSFTIELPVASEPATAAAARNPAAKTPSKSLKILLLEDHEDTAYVLAQVIRSLGHKVVVCGTVEQAVRKVEEESFDLILSDIGLPDGTGMDFIRKARETTATPAIALTGYGMAEDVERCLQAGFNDHLTKPIDFEKLQQTLHKMS